MKVFVARIFACWRIAPLASSGCARLQKPSSQTSLYALRARHLLFSGSAGALLGSCSNLHEKRRGLASLPQEKAWRPKKRSVSSDCYSIGSRYGSPPAFAGVGATTPANGLLGAIGILRVVRAGGGGVGAEGGVEIGCATCGSGVP